MSETTETALAVTKPENKQLTSPRTAAAYLPQNITEAMALAKLIASSDLATKDFRGKPGNVMIAMQMGAEIGLAPMQAIQNIAVINGRPSVWGDAALGIVQVHPAYEWHKEWLEGEGEKRVGIFQVKRKGQEVHEARFSFADAKKAGLWGKAGPWTQYSDRMLCLRARGFGLRDKFADALRGLIFAEEAMDLPEPPKRERAALDSNVLATLSPSEEPNRGHGNEGMQRSEPAPAETQERPAKEFVKGPVVVNKVEAHMKKPTKAMIDKAKAEKQPEPQGQEYFTLSCTGEDGIQHPVASWHKTLHEHVVRMQGKLCELTLEKRRKDDGTFTFSLEHIHRIGDQVFENDVPVAPAEQGEYQPPTGSELFPERK